ncbi:MAG: NAD(P)-binding domain-containing protein [Symploca sp. SIO2D2]|nr:NAD(P)-binding domain-containing protein [Symploca sp. SIO2D2]
MQHYDIGIIGAGWSGLMASKYAIQQGFTVLILEQEEHIGGVWKYSDSPNRATVIKSTETTSSRSLTEISDFPMPDDYPHFPHHSQIYTYLENYVKHFNLAEHIRWQAKVIKSEKKGNVWQVYLEDGELYQFNNLIVCAGLHQSPNDISQEKPFSNFTGKIIHSIAYKETLPEHQTKRILVVGGGETASDISNELSLVSQELYWSIRNGQWFINKWTPCYDRPFDEQNSFLERLVSPVAHFNAFYGTWLQWLWGYNGHGIPVWRSQAGYMRQFVNKSSAVLEKIKDGKIFPKPGVANIQGRIVYFTDGTQTEIDIIILCTGYKPVLTFLPQKYNYSSYERFLHIFDVEDPSIAFVGFVRPVIGSIPAIAEVQSKIIADVFAGNIILPNLAKRRKIAAKTAKKWRNYFRFTSQRIEGLVDISVYMPILYKFAGLYWPIFRFAFKNLIRFWQTITASYHGSFMLFNQKQYESYILERFQFYQPSPDSLRYKIIHGGWIVILLVNPMLTVYYYLKDFWHIITAPKDQILDK